MKLTLSPVGENIKALDGVHGSPRLYDRLQRNPAAAESMRQIAPGAKFHVDYYLKDDVAILVENGFITKTIIIDYSE